MSAPKNRSDDQLTKFSAGPPLEIAVDTEFRGPHTLTIQLAARVSPSRIAVQIYRSASIPQLSRKFAQDVYLPSAPDAYGRFCDEIDVHRPSLITADLSPVRMLADLFDLEGVVALSRSEAWGRFQAGPTNAIESPKTGQMVVPRIRLVLVGHFLPADFGRVFGRDFYADIFGSGPDRGSSLTFSKNKTIGLTYAGGSAFSKGAVVEFAEGPDGSIYEVSLETRDTTLLFGKGSLESLSLSFLGLPKSSVLSAGEKRDMLRTFQARPRAAYGYAMVDVVNTLLVYEQMKVRDAEIFRSFGIPEAEIPAMRPTSGGRVAQFLFTMARTAAAGSEFLSKNLNLGQLMKKGSINAFGGERPTSRFGHQTGQVHWGAQLQQVAHPVLARGPRDAPGCRHVGLLHRDPRRHECLLGTAGRPRARRSSTRIARGSRMASDERQSRRLVHPGQRRDQGGRQRPDPLHSMP